MSLISLALLTVQLVCIAMGVPYDQPIARQPVPIARQLAVVSQPLMKKPVVDHLDLGHSTIAAPVNRTISFATAHIYPSTSSPKDASVYTTDDNPALDDGPKTPVNGPYGVPYLATSFFPSNTKVRNKRDYIPEIIYTEEENTSNDYAHGFSRTPPILFHHEPYEVQTITGNGHSVTRITEYVTITELSRIRAPDCPTFNGPLITTSFEPHSRLSDYSVKTTTEYVTITELSRIRAIDYLTLTEYMTIYASDCPSRFESPSRLEDCDTAARQPLEDRQPLCIFGAPRHSCIVHPPLGVEGSAWTVQCTLPDLTAPYLTLLDPRKVQTATRGTVHEIIASAPPLHCNPCSSRLTGSGKCEFVRQYCPHRRG